MPEQSEIELTPEPDEMWAHVVDLQGVTWRRSGRGCWFAIRSEEACRSWADLADRGPLEVLR